MKILYWIKLTKAEINHINDLIERNERDGVYTAPMNHYWNRSNRIKKKLSDILKLKIKKP